MGYLAVAIRNALCSMRLKFIPMLHAPCAMRFCLVALPYALCSMLFLLLPVASEAQGLLQGISGSVEFNYSFLSTKTTDASGNTIKTNVNGYNPKFILDINTQIWPNLKLRTGGTFEGIIADIHTNGEKTKTTIINLAPYIDLTLETPLYKAGLGYQRLQQEAKVLRVPSTTLISDYYYGNFGWKPEGLPTVDILLSRRNIYDNDKSFLDIKEEFASLTSRYEYQGPIFQGLVLDYRGTYLHRRDDLIELDVTQYTHAGRVAYSNSFFDKRISLSTTYNILYQENITDSAGKGFVSTQVFPLGGLSSLDDFPLDGALDPNPALIDGNLTASAGIDIGLIQIGDDPRRRNIGLDFVTPTEVNKLFVWVDRALPPSISGVFPWDIYASSDNLNWVLVHHLFSAPFGPFDNRFEIKFPNVTARFIKVVTRGLTLADPGAAAFPDIFVTEMQAFLETSVKAGKETINRITHNYDLDVKAMILNNPSLYYELYYFFNRVEFGPTALQRYDLSNSLNVNHRFSQIFSGKAKVGIENGKRENEKLFAYFYDASLIADPLATLHNTLTFSGRNEEVEGRPNNINSLFLYNTAKLYQGIDIGLNGGLIFTKQETGEKGRDLVVNLQANIIPHRTITLGLNYSDTLSRRTGGERGSSLKNIQTLDFNVSYNPVRTLNLYATIQVIIETGQKTQTTQNYAVNWSPFPDGALQFNIAYNEDYNTQEHLKERIFLPSIRYNLSKRSYIDVSYQLIHSKSDIQKTDSNLFSTNVKIFF